MAYCVVESQGVSRGEGVGLGGRTMVVGRLGAENDHELCAFIQTPPARIAIRSRLCAAGQTMLWTTSVVRHSKPLC